MRILALDSATTGCSVAVAAGGRVIAEAADERARGQSEVLLPLALEALARAGLGFAELDRLAVTVGPGTFTGLRLGLAAARGLALATGLPLIGITTFEAVARGVPPAERQGRILLAAIDSRRAELFVQAFDGDLMPLGEPEIATPERLVPPPGRLILAGDAAGLLHPAMAARHDAILASRPAVPLAPAVALLAAERSIPPVPPAPLYLRAPDVTVPDRPAQPGGTS